ncbi:dehydrogenase [Phaeosphaeria sp. MPI-PUGE-AT-0046c]|nr:dehydrogenase [Phaeosphaeria sp. MPI-PUGE-AT-0046c]
MGGQLAFLLTQITFKPKPLPSGVRLDQQTAIITGSNIGIGLETARQLASHDVSRIILGVRDVNKGNAAKDDLAKSSPNCDFQVWELHQDSFDSIVAFSEKAKLLNRIDIVLLNAGVKQLKWATSPYGHEENVQVNHLGTALLSLLLLSPLKSTSQQTGQPGRLTITTSEVHFWTPFKEKIAPNILGRMDQKDSFGDGMVRYNTSKLLGVFWFRELASRVDAKEVIVNAPNPGFVASQFHRHDPSAGFKVLKTLLAWTPTQGAYFLTDAAATKQAESHGEYIQEQKITP